MDKVWIDKLNEEIKYIWSIDPYNFLSSYEISRVNNISKSISTYYAKTMEQYLSLDKKSECHFQLEALSSNLFTFINFFDRPHNNKEPVIKLDDLKRKQKKVNSILKKMRIEIYNEWLKSKNKKFEYHSAFGFDYKLKCYSRPLNFSFAPNTNIDDHIFTDDEYLYLINFFGTDISSKPIYSIEMALKNLLSN